VEEISRVMRIVSILRDDIFYFLVGRLMLFGLWLLCLRVMTETIPDCALFIGLQSK